MKLTEQSESEVRAVIDTYWASYTNGDVDAMIPLLDDDYTQVGSAEGEVFSNKGDAVQFLFDTIHEVAGNAELRNRITTIESFSDLVLVSDLCDLYVISGDEWIFYGKFRSSSFLRMDEEDGVWRMVHQHSSIPDLRTAEGGNLAIEHLADENRRLEQQVAERTAELQAAKREVEAALADLKVTQARLIQQEKMASLGQLTAGIAHEIKNPLSFVNNFAEVNEELADELREDLTAHPDALAAVEDLILSLQQNSRMINQHGKRADGIVHGMMQHASGGAGRRELCAINQLVSEHIDLAYHGKRAQVPEFNIEIVRNLDDAAGEMEIVPQEIGRVLLNLLGNAFDSVHEHALKVGDAYSPRVTISTAQRDGYVEIRVADNGPGIPDQVRNRIFEPFFTTKPTGSGTGLGLSLSYDIVTQGHAGSLTLDKSGNGGATFVVSLPNAR